MGKTEGEHNLSKDFWSEGRTPCILEPIQHALSEEKMSIFNLLSITVKCGARLKKGGNN